MPGSIRKIIPMGSLPYFLGVVICYFSFSYQGIFASEIQSDYRSALFLGRGDAGIASASGADAVFYNPAGIAQEQGILSELVLVSPQVEASQNVRDLTQSGSDQDRLDLILQNENKPYYAAVQNFSGVVFKKVAFGAFDRSSILANTTNDPTTGTSTMDISAVERYGGTLTLAHDFASGHILLGVTGKFVRKIQSNIQLSQSDVDTELSGTSVQHLLQNSEKIGNAIGADFGLMLILNKPTETQIGVTYRNLGMDYNFGTPSGVSAPDSDLQTLDGGISTSFGTKKSRIKLFADYWDIANQQQYDSIRDIHLGAEYSFVNVILIMVGYNGGYLTYGASLNLKIIRFEAGSYTEEIGNNSGDIPSQRYFARISIGWLL